MQAYKLERPSKPKPPSFFEQAYLGRSKAGSVKSDRANSVVGFKPYSDKPQDDALSYFEFKDQQEKSKEVGHFMKTAKRNSTQDSKSLIQRMKERNNKDKSKRMNMTFYKEDNDGLIKNPVYKLSQRNLKQLEAQPPKQNNSVMVQIGPNSVKGKERLERLRQKYLKTEVRQDKVPIVKQLPTLQKPANTRNEQKFETIQKEGTTIELENAEPPKEEVHIEEVNDINNEVKETNDIVIDQISEALSKTSKISGSVLLSLKKELEEEKKKRIELEQMVHELLSRTGYSQKNGPSKQGL